MLRMHWDIKTFDDQDYFELNKVMSAEKVESVQDFQTGSNLTEQELIDRNTSREQLDKQAGMQTLAAAIQHHKSRIAAENKGKEET